MTKPTRPALPRLPTAPAHLSRDARRWWRQIVETFILESHHLKLLEIACTSWDRMTAARLDIEKNGLTIVSTTGIRANPAIAIERDCRAGFMRAVRELDLGDEGPGEPRRPPSIRSNRG